MDGIATVVCVVLLCQGKEGGVERFLWRQGACAGDQIKVVGEDDAAEKGEGGEPQRKAFISPSCNALQS